MGRGLASLPMYDLPELRWATDAFWRAISRRLGEAGVADVPAQLTRDGAIDEHWGSPELLFSQTCGFPLVHAFAGRLCVVATPRYAAPGCAGSTYTSAIIVPEASSFAGLEDLRGAICAINDRASQSGMNALRAAIAPIARGAPFFREVVVTGAHTESLARVQRGDAGVCAIDAVTHALLARHRPAALAGTRVLAVSLPAPALPYVTRSRAPATLVAALRRALDEVMADPRLGDVREALLLDGVTALDPAAYAAIARMADAAIAQGYPDLA